MVKISSCVASACVLTIALGSVAQAATPIKGTVSAQVYGNFGGLEVLDVDTASWLFAPMDLNAFASVATGSGPAIQVEEFASGVWGANSGSASVTATWVFDAPPTGETSQAIIGGFPDWSYTFAADGDGVFRLDYEVMVAGLAVGLNGFNIGWSGPGEGQSLFDVEDPTTAGTFERPIEAGEVYIVTIAAGPNILSSGLNYRSSLIGTFRYSIAEDVGGGGGGVPEPGAWALMIAGFGLAGAALRRRRRFA